MMHLLIQWVLHLISWALPATIGVLLLVACGAAIAEAGQKHKHPLVMTIGLFIAAAVCITTAVVSWLVPDVWGVR